MNQFHWLGTKTQSDVYQSGKQQERTGEVLNLNVASQLPLEHTTKLERVNLCSSTQRPSTGTEDRFVELANQVGKMVERVRRFCQQMQDSISELRSRNESLTSELQRNQAELKESMNRCLTSECNRVANETSSFAQEQLHLSKQCLDAILRPQSQRYLAIHKTIIATLHEMSELLQNHIVTIQAWNGKSSELVIQVANACVSLKIEHDTLQSNVDTFLGRLSLNAATFSTDGLASELRARAKWSKNHELLEQLSSQSQLSTHYDETIGTTRNGLNSLSQLISDMLVEVEKIDNPIQSSSALGVDRPTEVGVVNPRTSGVRLRRRRKTRHKK